MTRHITSAARPAVQVLPVRARVQDAHGARWSIQARTVEQAHEIAAAQRATVVWVREFAEDANRTEGSSR